MRRVAWAGLVLVVCFAWASAARAALSEGEALDLLHLADEAFIDATRQLDDDPEAARHAFDQAIALWRRVLEEGELQSGPIHYNIGNAYLLSGEVGRAVLAYRRAERLMGADENLAANLALARQRVRSQIDPPGDARAARLLLFWHHDLSPRVRFVVLCASFALIWVVAGLRLAPTMRAAWTWWLFGGLAILCGAMGASLLVEERMRESIREGVIVAPSAVGRRGPDEDVYAPTFSEPLFQGVEFRVIEERLGWLLVELGDGRTTWLERRAIEII